MPRSFSYDSERGLVVQNPETYRLRNYEFKIGDEVTVIIAIHVSLVYSIGGRHLPQGGDAVTASIEITFPPGRSRQETASFQNIQFLSLVEDLQIWVYGLEGSLTHAVPFQEKLMRRMIIDLIVKISRLEGEFRKGIKERASLIPA